MNMIFRRRFQNWDVPYLAMFLSKNKNVTRLILANNKIDSAGFISLIDLMIVIYIFQTDILVC